MAVGRLTRLNDLGPVYGYDLGPRRRRPMPGTSGKVFIRSRLVWLAWYPLRRWRCSLFVTNVKCEWEPERNGWHVAIAFGPAFLGLGPGIPMP